MRQTTYSPNDLLNYNIFAIDIKKVTKRTVAMLRDLQARHSTNVDVISRVNDAFILLMHREGYPKQRECFLYAAGVAALQAVKAVRKNKLNSLTNLTQVGCKGKEPVFISAEVSAMLSLAATKEEQQQEKAFFSLAS